MLAAQDTQLEFALGQSLRTGHRPLLNAAMPKAGVHQLAHVLFELASGTQLLLNLVIRERLVDVAVFHGAQLHLPTAAQELVPQGHFDIGNHQNFIRDGGNTGPAQLDFFSHQRLSLGQLAARPPSPSAGTGRWASAATDLSVLARFYDCIRLVRLRGKPRTSVCDPYVRREG